VLTGANIRRSTHPLLHADLAQGHVLWPETVAQGPALVVVNHTCSADPAFVQGVCPRRLASSLPASITCRRACKDSSSHRLRARVAETAGDFVCIRAALRRLQEGGILVVFPEGGLSNAGRLRMRRGKAGVALLATA